MSTRSALAWALSVTVVRGRVNFNAFCTRLPTTDAEYLAVGLDHHVAVDRRHNQVNATGLGVQFLLTRCSSMRPETWSGSGF